MAADTTDVLAADIRPCSCCRTSAADAADVLAADTTDVSAADTTDVLAADTTHVLPAGATRVLHADKFGVGNPTIAHYFLTFWTQTWDAWCWKPQNCA